MPLSAHLMEAASGALSKKKARKILHDGTVHGKPLTEKQRRFMGARASGKKLKRAAKGATPGVMNPDEESFILVGDGGKDPSAEEYVYSPAGHSVIVAPKLDPKEKPSMSNAMKAIATTALEGKLQKAAGGTVISKGVSPYGITQSKNILGASSSGGGGGSAGTGLQSSSQVLATPTTTPINPVITGVKPQAAYDPGIERNWTSALLSVIAPPEVPPAAAVGTPPAAGTPATGTPPVATTPAFPTPAPSWQDRLIEIIGNIGGRSPTGDQGNQGNGSIMSFLEALRARGGAGNQNSPMQFAKDGAVKSKLIRAAAGAPIFDAGGRIVGYGSSGGGASAAGPSDAMTQYQAAQLAIEKQRLGMQGNANVISPYQQAQLDLERQRLGMMNQPTQVDPNSRYATDAQKAIAQMQIDAQARLAGQTNAINQQRIQADMKMAAEEAAINRARAAEEAAQLMMTRAGRQLLAPGGNVIPSLQPSVGRTI